MPDKNLRCSDIPRDITPEELTRSGAASSMRRRPVSHEASRLRIKLGCAATPAPNRNLAVCRCRGKVGKGSGLCAKFSGSSPQRSLGPGPPSSPEANAVAIRKSNRIKRRRKASNFQRRSKFQLLKPSPLPAEELLPAQVVDRRTYLKRREQGKF